MSQVDSAPYWKQKTFTRGEVVAMLLTVVVCGAVIGGPIGYYWAATKYPHSYSTTTTLVIVSVPQLNATLTPINATASHGLNATRIWIRFDMHGGRPYLDQGTPKYSIIRLSTSYIFPEWGQDSPFLQQSGFLTSFLVWGQAGNVTLRFLVVDHSDGVQCAPNDSYCQASHYSGQEVELDKTIGWA